MFKLQADDITKIQVDAIVNAANTSLLGGGGVDGAIHRNGGPEILEACQKIRSKQGGCQPGNAVFTPAGLLPSKWVIHTVGPVWQNGVKGEPEILKQCYLNALNLARELQAGSIAFPNISTGIYGFPKALAADIALASCQEFADGVKVLPEIIFVCFDQENYQLYADRLGNLSN